MSTAAFRTTSKRLLSRSTIFACFYCNTNEVQISLASITQTDDVVRLYHPRNDKWDEHFLWDGPMLRPRNLIGLVTIDVLRINDPEYIQVRRSLIAEGVLPTISPAS